MSRNLEKFPYNEAKNRYPNQKCVLERNNHSMSYLKDFITKNSAIPAKEAKTKKRKIWFLSVIGVQTHGWNKAKIKTLVYAVKKAVVKGSSVEAINLDIIWRNAKSSAAIIINIWPKLIISKPGLIIIKVPENPMITASQRRIPIGSFRIK